MLDIYLIRHAESEGNVNHHIIGGRSDYLPLTERGVLQARKLGKRFQEEGIQFQYVFSSVAERAKHTAQIVCEALSYPQDDIQFSEDIVELSQGEWEGRIREEIFTPERRSEMEQNPWDFIPPNGESVRDVEERMYTWIQDHIIPLQSESARVAIVSHGMAIKSLLRKILDSAPHMTRKTILHNTSLCRFLYKDNSWLLERINDHTHLNGTGFVDHYD